MFDTEDFIATCIRALRETEPRVAIREVLTEAMANPDSVAQALRPSRAEIVRLHASAELTIIHVVWAPGMSFGPHDHRMWAAIGVYSGGEDNSFFRRAGDTLTASGGKSLRAGDVILLGDDAIHAVVNPTTKFAGAIHVYGGDFFNTTRSEWRGEPYREQPYDSEYVINYFEAANRRLGAVAPL
jgi:predicted metal-dependent enzyme (double-stranded beta helix superfamily)